MIKISESYEQHYKRIRYLVDYLDSISPSTKLINSPSFKHSLEKHKYYIDNENPLQILIAEALYLLKLNKEYKQEYLLSLKP